MGAAISVVSGTIADTFAPYERGTAMGLFFIPLLVGPIAAPVVGGGLTAAFGWRSLFTFLAIFTAPVIALAAWLPETHHWFVLRARNAAVATLGGGGGAALPPVKGAAMTERPKFRPPWRPLVLLWDVDILPYAVMGSLSFGTMFVALTQLPGILVADFGFPAGTVGALFIPNGICSMIGSQLGGRAADWAAAAAGPGRPSARMLPGVCGLCLLVAGMAGFGWAAADSSLTGILVSHCLIGLGQSLFGPGQSSYLSSMRQQEAASITSAGLAAQFAASGAFISAAVPVAAAVGTGGLFSILAALDAVALAWCVGHLVWRRRTAAVATAAAVRTACSAAETTPGGGSAPHQRGV